MLLEGSVLHLGAENGWLPQREQENIRLHHRQAAREQPAGVSRVQDLEIAFSLQVPAAARSELRDEAQLNGFSHVLKDQAYLETHGALEI